VNAEAYGPSFPTMSLKKLTFLDVKLLHNAWIIGGPW